MSNYANLKSAIQSVIKTNGNNEITGQLLQNELLAMITTLGFGYQFMGIAHPNSYPGTPDAKVFYIAYEAGTYVNMGGIVVTGLCVLRYDTSWAKEDIPISGGTSFTPNAQDLELDDSVLQFANRVNGVNTTGMGYKILRPGADFASQVTDTNTIYEIRYPFDLDNESVNVPSGCILFFNGGKVANGTLVGNSTEIVASGQVIFDTITFSGTFANGEISPKWFAGTDTVALSAAVSMASFSNDAIVVIDRTYSITSTITGVVNMKMIGGGNLSIDANVDGLVISKDRAVVGGGKIKVTVDGYTGKAVTLSSPLHHITISDLVIEGKTYTTPSGTGIFIGTSGGRHFGHIIKDVFISYFDKGIDIDSSGSWANNFKITAGVSYNNVSVNISGANESCGHEVELYGQAPLNVANGVIIRDTNATYGSNWILNVFDIGNTGYISKVIDIKRGYVVIPTYQLRYCVKNGRWTYNGQFPYSGADSCINNCDAASWVVKSLIGSASGITSNKIMSYGQASAGSDALAWCTQAEDGVKFDITFPTSIWLNAIILCADENQAPQKIVITATGSSGTETAEISGDMIIGGRAFRYEELFTWRSAANCSKVTIEILGSANGTYPAYTRLRYLGINDRLFRKFTA